MKVRVIIPGLRTWSSLNERVHWATRAKRAKRERSSAAQYYLSLPGTIRHLLEDKDTPVTVKLLRESSGTLDKEDNLHASMKGVRDGVADALNLDNDRDPRITWEYGQIKGKRGDWAVHMEFTA